MQFEPPSKLYQIEYQIKKKKTLEIQKKKCYKTIYRQIKLFIQSSLLSKSKKC